MNEHYQIDTDLSFDDTISELARASDFWGATFTPEGNGGRLDLPVLSGLKHGLLAGRIRVEPTAAGSRIVFEVETSRYRLQRSAVSILILGGLGGIAATLWPFFPALLGIAPLAVVVAIGAWILVASRLQTSTVHEFLDLVAGATESSADN